MEELNKKIILDFLKEHKAEFIKKYHLTKIGIFGSYAKDTATKDSDIDIIVDMPSSFKNYYELKSFLENHFHKKVDLGMENTIRTFVKNKIQKDIIYV